MQQGFLTGRSMNANILQIDYYMKQYAFTTADPAVVLFDFAAAFPSVSQTFMWRVIGDLGLSPAWVNFLKLFYN
eukprot:11374260-Prorocentrum_lima.AAC.1